ncbi:MAG: hypothetical protein ACP5PR_01345 [Minisyncoccia bacterium]
MKKYLFLSVVLGFVFAFSALAASTTIAPIPKPKPPIPITEPKPPIPEIKQCQTDSDCTWCGMSCVNKEEIKGKACPQVMPREGLACKCVNNRCMVVPLTGPTTSLFTNKAQILQEMERVRNQIKVLEQRLKELEKLLKIIPTTSNSENQ